MEKRYIVAEHCFTVQAPEEVFECMSQYEPFIAEATSPDVFRLTVCRASEFSEEMKEEYRQKEEDYTIVYGHSGNQGHIFLFNLRDQAESWLSCSEDLSEGTLYLVGSATKFSVNNALMLMYALSTATLGTLFFHAAVVSYQGRGYMFLGKSGTGKSTHLRLWLQYIEGTERINDDNPVVRIHENGDIWVYGSPWSGKTPCYRQVKYPLGGMVQLKQAPYNKIQRVKGMTAFMFIRRGASGMRWDRKIADGLHYSENMLAQTVPVWFLECLPDEAAARLCHSEITR